jgi:hypothetical protein
MDMQGMQGLPSLQAVPPPLSTSSLQSSPKSLEPVSSESPPSSSVPKPLDAAPGLGVAQAPAKKGFFGFLQKQKKAMDAPPLPI